MGRYTGPKTKVSRRYGVPLFGPAKALERTGNDVGAAERPGVCTHA